MSRWRACGQPGNRRVQALEEDLHTLFCSTESLFCSTESTEVVTESCLRFTMSKAIDTMVHCVKGRQRHRRVRFGCSVPVPVKYKGSENRLSSGKRQIRKEEWVVKCIVKVIQSLDGSTFNNEHGDGAASGNLSSYRGNTTETECLHSYSHSLVVRANRQLGS